MSNCLDIIKSWALACMFLIRGSTLVDTTYQVCFCFGCRIYSLINSPWNYTILLYVIKLCHLVINELRHLPITSKSHESRTCLDLCNELFFLMIELCLFKCFMKVNEKKIVSWSQTDSHHLWAYFISCCSLFPEICIYSINDSILLFSQNKTSPLASCRDRGEHGGGRGGARTCWCKCPQELMFNYFSFWLCL